MADSFTLKLDRAQEHLQAFEIEADAWVETKPYRLVDEPDPNPRINQPGDWLARHRRFRLESIDPVPDRLGVLIGDCLFNMRSALDHLALSLAQSFTPNMTDNQIATSEFPIFAAAPMDSRTETRKIGCIDPAARDVIKALQPHHQGNNYHAHPLWQLHELNRVDKHRALTACTAMPLCQDTDGVTMLATGFIKHSEWNISKILRFTSTPRELVLNAVFARYSALAADPEKDVYMQPVISAKVAFGDTSPAHLEPVVPTVKNILDFVSKSVTSPLSLFL